MGTVSVRVPDEVKARMDEHEEINWSAVIRRRIEEELVELEGRSLAHAVATSERLSGEIEAAAVEDEEIADTVRSFRDSRYGGDAA